jgi:hypothetical protein
MIIKMSKNKVFVYGALAVFAALLVPAGLFAGPQATAAATGSLTGFIYAKDMKTPVEGAIVKVRNIEDGKEFSSPPTDANGLYTIANIPEGRYMLGVTSGEGDFNFDYVINVKAGELGKLTVALAPEAKAQRVQDVAAKKTGFFNSFAGRAILVTALGVGLYFLVEGEASPIR